jgi:hypothetical protein
MAMVASKSLAMLSELPVFDHIVRPLPEQQHDLGSSTMHAVKNRNRQMPATQCTMKPNCQLPSGNSRALALLFLNLDDSLCLRTEMFGSSLLCSHVLVTLQCRCYAGRQLVPK